MNLSGLIVLVFLFKEIINICLFYSALAFLSVVVGLSVFIFSNLSWYAGLSAVLYGLFIISAVVALIKKDWLLSLPVLLVIPIKLIFDSYDPSLTASSAEFIGAPVATEVHGYGVLAGFFVGIMLLIFKPKRLIK